MNFDSILQIKRVRSIDRYKYFYCALCDYWLRMCNWFLHLNNKIPQDKRRKIRFALNLVRILLIQIKILKGFIVPIRIFRVDMCYRYLSTLVLHTKLNYYSKYFLIDTGNFLLMQFQKFIIANWFFLGSFQLQFIYNVTVILNIMF